MKSKNFLEIKENWAASNGSFFFCAKIASSFTEINGYLKGVKGVWTK